MRRTGSQAAFGDDKNLSTKSSVTPAAKVFNACSTGGTAKISERSQRVCAALAAIHSPLSSSPSLATTACCFAGHFTRKNQVSKRRALNGGVTQRPTKVKSVASRWSS